MLALTKRRRGMGYPNAFVPDCRVKFWNVTAMPAASYRERSRAVVRIQAAQGRQESRPDPIDPNSRGSETGKIQDLTPYLVMNSTPPT